MAVSQPYPVLSLPHPLQAWGEARGLLGPEWEWELLPPESLIPVWDQDAYQVGKTPLRHVGDVGTLHYYAGTCCALSQVYWTAVRRWQTVSVEEAYGF